MTCAMCDRSAIDELCSLCAVLVDVQEPSPRPRAYRRRSGATFTSEWDLLEPTADPYLPPIDDRS